MRVSKVTHGGFLIEYRSNYLLAASFMRMQEYYESPLRGFRGRHFTHEMFMDAYAAKYGNFTYTSDWAGFNVPGSVVRRFFTLFRDLDRKETCLHEAVLPMIEQFGDAFYLIGSLPGDMETLKHEAAHSFYYLDQEYRRAMDLITRGWRHASRFKETLVKHGYNASVARDETQAYMATSTRGWLSSAWGFRPRPPLEYAKVFQRRWKGRLA